jgi:hypothetical protein
MLRGGAMPEAAVPGASLLFLREEHIRQAQDMFFLAWRDLANLPSTRCSRQHGLGRAHHRALHFIGRHPGLTVTDLLSMLCVTKQSLSRVLAPLVAQGFVLQVSRPRRPAPAAADTSPRPATLERELFERQRERLVASPIARRAPPAVDGFRRVMRGVMDDAARAYLDGPDRTPRAGHLKQGQGLCPWTPPRGAAPWIPAKGSGPWNPSFGWGEGGGLRGWPGLPGSHRRSPV